MIIQINATVCVDMDHGDDRHREIADSDAGGERWEGREKRSDQDSKNFWTCAQK